MENIEGDVWFFIALISALTKPIDISNSTDLKHEKYALKATSST
jgi:hypothetical protein